MIKRYEWLVYTFKNVKIAIICLNACFFPCSQCEKPHAEADCGSRILGIKPKSSPSGIEDQRS